MTPAAPATTEAPTAPPVTAISPAVGVPGAGAPSTPPSMAQMGHSLFSSAVNFLASGKPLVNEAQAAARLAFCVICPNFDEGVLGGRCLHCGCLTFAKLRLASERCPLGIWGEIPKSEDYARKDPPANA